MTKHSPHTIALVSPHFIEALRTATDRAARDCSRACARIRWSADKGAARAALAVARARHATLSSLLSQAEARAMVEAIECPALPAQWAPQLPATPATPVRPSPQPAPHRVRESARQRSRARHAQTRIRVRI
jgi:hypothetical protein